MSFSIKGILLLIYVIEKSMNYTKFHNWYQGLRSKNHLYIWVKFLGESCFVIQKLLMIRKSPTIFPKRILVQEYENHGCKCFKTYLLEDNFIPKKSSEIISRDFFSSDFFYFNVNELTIASTSVVNCVKVSALAV